MALQVLNCHVSMLAAVTISLIAFIGGGIASLELEELKRRHPTWTFEVQSVEKVVINATRRLAALRGLSLESAEEIVREKLTRELTPGATYIIRKTGDPKWIANPKKIPYTFNAREKWKNCASVLSYAEDEGPCRSDAPAVVASVMSDRYCIFTEGAFKEQLSQEMLMGCSALCTHSPLMSEAWKYAEAHGIPTGGSHGSGKGCLPYSYSPCVHDNSTYIREGGRGRTNLELCSKQFIYDHDCPKKCSNKKYSTPLDKDRIKLTAWYYVSNHEFAIRNEILAYGSVATSVTLFSDFLEKPDGIFQRKPGREFLAFDKFFKIIGWGEENNIKYWLCVHTWDTWGDKIFKFPRGENYDLVELIPYTGVYEDLG